MSTNPSNIPPTTTHVHDDAASSDDLREKLSAQTPAWKPILVIFALLLALGALIAVGAFPKLERQRDLAETNQRLAETTRRVQLGAIRLSPAVRTITLPASIEPNARADLFAQATGFVRERKVDIGAQVHAGDVLAVIDIPLVEEELNRARASLAEAQAAQAEVEKTRSLAQSTLERWTNVQPAGAVSQQEIDERRSAFEAAQAAQTAAEAVVATRRADLQRLERQLAFARVVAPFDGRITARNIDVGDYISNTGPGSSPLFAIADTRELRVFVDVPQIYASSIVAGQTARVLIRGVDTKLEGKVARTSGVLNEKTRTLRVEVALANEDGRVLAGAYGQVQFEVRQSSTSVIIPGSALLVRAEGPRVAIVDDDSRLRYINVTVARDLGTEIEISQGLVGNERVVVNMADELPEGEEVQIVPVATDPKQGTTAKTGTTSNAQPSAK